jgi:hypothetical protein
MLLGGNAPITAASDFLKTIHLKTIHLKTIHLKTIQLKTIHLKTIQQWDVLSCPARYFGGDCNEAVTDPSAAGRSL